MEKIQKNLWMPVIKDAATGKYSAVLSDSSLDRDDEAMAPELIKSFANNKSLKALVNHENKMQSWVGGWNNLRDVQKGEHTALFAEPWFFSAKANPLAELTKNQVDEAMERGEHPGISIGAIITDYETRKINGKDVRVFTKGELLEGTWVPIQSNRNASFGHVAKGFNADEYFNKEETKVEKEFTKDNLDAAVTKAVADVKQELEKQLNEKDAEIEKHKSSFDEVNKSLAAANEELAKSKEALVKSGEELASAKAEAEAAKKAALEKQKIADNGSSPEDVKKGLDEGKLPVMRE